MFNQYEIVVGGGPVGCYLAYKLLTIDPRRRVVLFESKLFERPQVIRVPFAVADDLPLEIKNQMWSDPGTRSRIFDPGFAGNSSFWPKPDYSFWPWISISAFQKTIIDYLKTSEFYKERFFFIPDDGNIAQSAWQAAIEKEYPRFDSSIIQSTRALFCTCGRYAKGLRQELNLLEGKEPEAKGHGIYLIYQNNAIEDYKRNGHPLSYLELGHHGISYAASNNSALEVQLYTYPEGNLSVIFQDIPDEFIQRTVYGHYSEPLDMTGLGLTPKTKDWFERYKSEVLEVVHRFNIPVPQSLTQIKVFYAPRTEYYWKIAAACIPWQGQTRPLFFLGDSAGSTDYKSGLSMGRGLLSVQALAALIATQNDDLSTIVPDFQNYWQQIVAREFNKGPKLSSEPWVQYRYLIKGRKVLYPDNSRIHYLNDNQYPAYHAEYQALLPDYYRTSEAGAVLFINTWALEDNIKKIRDFAASSANSKIIAVVKSDGYGFGADLVTETVIKTGIDFIGVAKLEEAVAIRKSGIPGVDSLRIAVFEAPLAEDILTYRVNRIELILPADKLGQSVKILEQGLNNKLFTEEIPLRVHIMVDTGMRRDSGYDNSTPESILSTLKTLHSLPSKVVEFAGLATHLSCYRCTDYQGKEVIDYRALQLQRFHHVIETLLAYQVSIPLIQVGGGLGLLGERWPSQFESLTQDQGIQLYTRVGHGLYGMELQRDLRKDCPVLWPTGELNLQVRHVFFVEEKEPVSYGGLWRAPVGGAWIATLSGGWADGIPRTVHTLGAHDSGMMVGINDQLYPVVGTINMNATMVNLGATTSVQAGDRAVIFGWRAHEPQLNTLAEISGQISPSITVNIPARIPRIRIAYPVDV